MGARGGWPLGGLTACALVPALVLAALNASRLGTVRTGSGVLLAVAVGVGLAAGQLIISRLPGNATGWLLGLGGCRRAGGAPCCGR